MKTIYIVTPGSNTIELLFRMTPNLTTFLIRFFLNNKKNQYWKKKRKESCIQLRNFITTNKQENIKKNKKVYKTIYNKKEKPEIKTPSNIGYDGVNKSSFKTKCNHLWLLFVDGIWWLIHRNNERKGRALFYWGKNHMTNPSRWFYFYGLCTLFYRIMFLFYFIFVSGIYYLQ